MAILTRVFGQDMTVSVCKCERCGYAWLPQQIFGKELKKPKTCANYKCRQKKWNMPKIYKKRGDTVNVWKKLVETSVPIPALNERLSEIFKFSAYKPKDGRERIIKRYRELWETLNTEEKETALKAIQGIISGV
jgi:hypothetical protein